MRILALFGSTQALKVNVINGLPDTGSCAGYELNIFSQTPGHVNIAPGGSREFVQDFSQWPGQLGIQINVMTWSYDFAANDGHAMQCNGEPSCLNPDNSSLQLYIENDCTASVYCSGQPKGVVPANQFCRSDSGYGVPTNGISTITLARTANGCDLTVSAGGSWDKACAKVNLPQSPGTKIPPKDLLFWKGLTSDIRNPPSGVMSEEVHI